MLIIPGKYSPGVCDDVGQSAAFQKLHDDPQLVPYQVAVVHLYHVVMVIVPHDNHLQEMRAITQLLWEKQTLMVL